jgi:hypothetical protein
MSVIALAAATTTGAPALPPVVEPGYAFKVCGHFCGPGWCNNGWMKEGICDESMSPVMWKPNVPSCADACCQMHDRCCGHREDQRGCNKAITQCLNGCNPLDVSCGGIPSGAVWAGMKIVESYCCGSPCGGSNNLTTVEDVVRSIGSQSVD